MPVIVGRQATSQNLTYKAPIEHIPEHYQVIGLVGKGVTSEVYLCLPKSALSAAKASFADGEPNKDLIKSELVAVKALMQHYAYSTKDISMLRLLRSKDQQDIRVNRFQQIVASDPGFDIDGGSRWVATKPILGSVSITDFHLLRQQLKFRMPEEFILHIFVQVSEALGFLRNAFDPSIVHRDLHFGNILLDGEHQDTPGFPNLVVIDFGHSSRVASDLNDPVALYTDQGTCQDSAMFFDSLRDLSQYDKLCKCRLGFPGDSHCDVTHVIGWAKFWKHFRNAANEVQGTPFETEWRRAERIAKRVVASTKEDIFLEIKGTLLHLIEKRAKMLDDRLTEVLCS